MLLPFGLARHSAVGALFEYHESCSRPRGIRGVTTILEIVDSDHRHCDEEGKLQLVGPDSRSNSLEHVTKKKQAVSARHFSMGTMTIYINMLIFHFFCLQKKSVIRRYIVRKPVSVQRPDIQQSLRKNKREKERRRC